MELSNDVRINVSTQMLPLGEKGIEKKSSVGGKQTHIPADFVYKVSTGEQWVTGQRVWVNSECSVNSLQADNDCLTEKQISYFIRV